MTVKTVIFRRFLFVGAPNGLRIVCGISIRKSVNSAGLERGFSGKNRPFTHVVITGTMTQNAITIKVDGGKTDFSMWTFK